MSLQHRGCLPDGGARGEGFALNELPHPCCVLYLSAKVWFFFEIAMALVVKVDNICQNNKDFGSPGHLG